MMVFQFYSKSKKIDEWLVIIRYMRNYFNQAKLMDYHLHWGDLESVIQLISFAGLSAMINAAASQTIAIDSLINVLAKK